MIKSLSRFWSHSSSTDVVAFLLHARVVRVPIVDNLLGVVLRWGTLNQLSQPFIGLQHKYVVVQAHAQDQDNEADNLQAVERLPANGQRYGPHYERSHRIEHHAGGGGEFFGHGNAGKIEEGNRDNGASQRDNQLIVLEYLAERVDYILHGFGGVIVEGRPDVDIVHGEE